MNKYVLNVSSWIFRDSIVLTLSASWNKSQTFKKNWNWIRYLLYCTKNCGLNRLEIKQGSGSVHNTAHSTLCNDISIVTFPFIFSLIIKSRHFFQSPFLIALEAATTCSRIDSGGPTKACRSLDLSWIVTNTFIWLMFFSKFFYLV